MDTPQPTTPKGRVASVESEPVSPRRSLVDDDNVATKYESSVEKEEAAEERKEDTPPVPATLLSEDPFSNESSRILFDSIDQLRRCGAGQDLDLPQLVIVGKQSAGKSSLLQSLTDIPFPVGNKLCTQFAMRIVSRRTAPGTSEMVHASIEAGDVNPFSVRDDARTENFDQRVPSMTAEAFEQLIVEAKEAMGIGSPLVSEDKNYSSKVLKIELSGPKRSHFAILDLPGVFSSRRGGVSKREMDGVLSMVKSYMRKPENIVICCADASGDIQNEQILELASDVHSSRLVGVLTKCDNSENPNDIVQYVNDRDGIPGKPLRWHVVQNRGPKANSSFDRVKEEAATFNRYPWNKIPDDQRGTASLKKYLANLLCTRIRDGFPTMLKTVKTLLRTEKDLRKQMGDARQDHAQKVAYLVDISQKFEKLAHQALEEPGRLPLPVLKLRGQAEKLKETFTQEMMEKGFFHKFLEIGESISIVLPAEPEVEYESEDDQLSLPRFNARTPIRNNGKNLPTPVVSPSRKTKAPVTKTEIQPLYLEIRKQIIENRGEELPGMLNPAVLRPLWRTQTSKWEDLGMDHLNELVDLTTDISIRLFTQACKEARASERAWLGLQAKLLSFSQNSRSHVQNQLHELCLRNSTMALQTNNPDFLQKVRSARMQRFCEALDRYTRIIPAATFMGGGAPKGCEKMAIVDEAHVKDLFNELHPNGARAQNVEDEIHDLLKAYYEVTLQNFIYDVTRNINEPFLLDKNGPLLGLSTEFIMGLSEEEVAELGGEEEGVVVQRREIDGKIKRLEEAVGIAGVSLGRTRGVVMAVGA